MLVCQDELTAERNRQKYALKKEHIVRYLDCFVGNLNESSLRDKVLDYLIKKIYTYDSKVVVHFYYSEDKREINLDESNNHLNNLDKIIGIIDGGTENTTGYQKKLDAMWESIVAKDGDKVSF